MSAVYSGNVFVAIPNLGWLRAYGSLNSAASFFANVSDDVPLSIDTIRGST
jgi:hypothetical protein